jgi:hypothetical protein
VRLPPTQNRRRSLSRLLACAFFSASFGGYAFSNTSSAEETAADPAPLESGLQCEPSEPVVHLTFDLPDGPNAHTVNPAATQREAVERFVARIYPGLADRSMEQRNGSGESAQFAFTAEGRTRFLAVPVALVGGGWDVGEVVGCNADLTEARRGVR